MKDQPYDKIQEFIYIHPTLLIRPQEMLWDSMHWHTSGTRPNIVW